MSSLSARAVTSLRTRFGPLVRTDLVERKLYSHDVGDLPKLVAPLVPAGVAGAVVRPQNEAQVVELLAFARREGVPVVPRGMSTSGYGGVLPRAGAIVADMSGLAALVSADGATLTARVQPGILWERLQRQLHPFGLDVRLYPSSSPASTVGGWLAQGGAGIGSFEYGLFKENVVSARVALPDGAVRAFEGEELLRLVADAEGITGVVTEVTLRLRPLEAEVHRLFAFPTEALLGKALQAVVSRQLPIWSLSFFNPESIRMRKRLPRPPGHPYQAAAHRAVELPETYVALLAYPTSRRVQVDAALADIAAGAQGVDLGEEAAEHEWALRFSPMRLKRIGPSVVPAEVVVPLSELAPMLSALAATIRQPFVLEGMCVKGERVVLLGFIPHDARTLAYNAAFALALTVTNLAKRHGGTAYSTGLFFRSEARALLGTDKVHALQRFKQEHDPRDLMNPDKVIGTGMLRVAMDVASSLEPLLRPIANVATARPSDAETSPDVRGLPGDVAFYAYACAQCGYCVPSCEEFSVRGWESHSPRGKYRYLREVAEGREKIDQRMVDTFLVCTTCEVCNTRCQLQLPVEHSWMKMRGRLIHDEKRMTFPPFEMMAASLRGERNIWAAKAEHRADWVPPDMKPKLKAEGPLLYFAGCTASYVNTDVAEATVRLLTDAGYDIAYMGQQESCCGIPMKVAGKWDLFEEIYAHNTEEAHRRGAKTIVTSCPACALVWKEMYPDVAKDRGEVYDFEVKHYSELISDALKDGRLVLDKAVKARVTFHDSCHIGRAQGIYEAPRELLRAMPGVELVEMEHNRANALCCGSVLTLVGEKPVAPLLGGQRLREATAAGAEKLVTLCPCCQVQLRDSAKRNNIDMPVTDLARFVAEAKGYTIADKTDRSLYLWGFFDKFIDLMKPAEMAKVMSDVFPQMLNAMPLGMKPMLRAMRYIPGGLWLVSKLLPLLFPLLASGILAKAMPDLITAVRRRVGTMPADMEALVPDLLPKTMESLMPNYLPQLIPFVTPLFVEHLRTA